MRALETLLVQIDEIEHIDDTRREIFSLLCQAVDTGRDNLDRWQAFHLANAISALALNMNMLEQPSLDWLRLCLNDVRLAYFPPSARRHAIESTVLDHVADLPDYDNLLDKLATLAPKIPMPPERHGFPHSGAGKGTGVAPYHPR